MKSLGTPRHIYAEKYKRQGIINEDINKKKNTVYI